MILSAFIGKLNPEACLLLPKGWSSSVPMEVPNASTVDKYASCGAFENDSKITSL